MPNPIHGFIVVLSLDSEGFNCYKVKRVNIQHENQRQQQVNTYQNIYLTRPSANSEASALNTHLQSKD